MRSLIAQPTAQREWRPKDHRQVELALAVLPLQALELRPFLGCQRFCEVSADRRNERTLSHSSVSLAGRRGLLLSLR
jgi:hypothetical protein